METPQAVLTARPPCQCHGLEQPPKILHSILSYHFNNYDMTVSREGGPGSTCSSPGCSSPRDSYSPALSHASGYRSPSPAPNPSPSPPAAAWAESKLYNILKGNSSSASGRPGSSSPYSSSCSSSSSSSSSGYSSSSPVTTDSRSVNLKRARDSSDEPMDLSCKKLHRDRSAGEGNTSRSSTPVNTGLPMDLSSRSNTPRSVTSSPLSHAWAPSVGTPGTNSDSSDSLATNNNNNSSSILKSILCGQVSSGLLGGRAPTPASSPCPSSPASPAPSISSVHSQPASPGCFPSSPRCHGSRMVTLAKKNLYPVSARVSDWLVKIVQFTNTLPEFISLSHNDKVQLVLNSWARLLLLYMAENNFHFVVTPMGNEESQDEKVASNPDTPTMRSVDALQAFLRKCQSLHLDSKEYDYIRMITLFKQGYTGVENPQYIESISSYVRQSLQDHIRATRPSERLRYSHILLALPTLFGVNPKMVEKLFCKHISTNMDVEVLLKEMLQKLS